MKLLFFFLITTTAAMHSTARLTTVQHRNVRSWNSPASLRRMCDHAHDFKESCRRIVSEVSQNQTQKTNGKNFIEQVLRDSTHRINVTTKKVKHVGLRISRTREQASLTACAELMDLSLGRIIGSIETLKKVNASTESRAEAHTWLSTVLTNHMTCLEELRSHNMSKLEKALEDLIVRARTSLSAFVSVYIRTPAKAQAGFSFKEDFPSWVAREDRELLKGSNPTLTANVVVAKDGSGKYKKISDAIAAAPSQSNTRYVIYVKKGKYKETVRLGSSLRNIMLVGDGMTSTIISGSANAVDGKSTFDSATVAAVGDDFILQDIGIENTAGPEKHQAVALRIGGDRSVVNRCQIDGYQDTLYAHSNRQFYRDCTVTGTVDFIFGNAAVVLQNCRLVVRRPMAGQKNTITAQGRTDSNQNTGTSIQNCNIVPSDDLPVNTVNSYLGRPWKSYSRTVVMQSYIGSFINPAGWLAWKGNFALDTLYYGEYMNQGGGADTSQRVNWPGYQVIKKSSVAAKFTVAQLIQGDSWLGSTGVTYNPGL